MSFLKKILGWALLFLGLIVIFYSLYSSYNIFTAETEAPQIFTAEQEESVVPSTGGSLQEQLEKTIQEQLRGVLPADSIFTLLNLVAWSIFAGILIFGGAQISGLGIKLIK